MRSNRRVLKQGDDRIRFVSLSVDSATLRRIIEGEDEKQGPAGGSYTAQTRDDGSLDRVNGSRIGKKSVL